MTNVIKERVNTSNQNSVSIYIRSSDSSAKNTFRNKYQQTITPPISAIDSEESIRVSLRNFTFVNSFYNIKDGTQLVLYEYHTADPTKDITHTFDIPAGHYTAATLLTYFLSMLATDGSTTFFGTTRGFQAAALSTTTYKINFTRTYTGTHDPGNGAVTYDGIRFLVNNASIPILKVLGILPYDTLISDLDLPSYAEHAFTGATSVYTPPLLPDFLGVRTIRIKSPSLGTSAYSSNTYSLTATNIVSQVTVTQPFSYTQVYEPTNENWFYLRGDEFALLEMILEDGLDQPLDTQDFPFSMEFRVEFMVPKFTVKPDLHIQRIDASHTGQGTQLRDPLGHTQDEKYKRHKRAIHHL